MIPEQIEALALRLRGRADMIQRTAADVVIRDLKTGRVLTNEGDVLPHIERQMRLYGAMARAIWPSADVSLVVDHGLERAVDRGAEAREAILQQIVIRPGMKRLDRHILANLSGHDNEGNFLAGFLEHFQCSHSAEARDDVVGNDQVPWLAIQFRAHAFGILNERE